MSPFLVQALGALSSCKSKIDYYRAQIELQKFATPADIAELAGLSAPWSPDFTEWLEQHHRDLLAISPVIQGYRLERIGPTMSLYVGPAPAPVLLLGFAGQADLLFMPTAMFLQHFAAERHALLMLRDPSRTGFINGMQGHSSTFAEMVDRMSRELHLDKVGDVRVVGTSGGGAAAIAAGGLLSATTSVAFSGHLPSASPRYGTGPNTSAFEALLAEVGPRSRGTCVYAGKNDVDAAAAKRLAAFARLRAIAVPGASTHNVVYELLGQHLLAQILAELGLTT